MLALTLSGIYAFHVHKLAQRSQAARRRPARRSHLSATRIVRRATAADAADIALLVSIFAAQGLMLSRTSDEIEATIDDYLVVVDAHERLRGCAALHSYSPSLAEVASVAVDRSSHRSGLGALVVRGVEAMARRRGHREVFAVTLASGFFDSLGYEDADLERYPEKLARYEQLAENGVQVTPKACVRKTLG